MTQLTSTTLNNNDDRADLVTSLSASILDKLQAARGNPMLLQSAVEEFYTKATSAGLTLSEMEDILGVNESCVMDLAELNETDEEVVINAFELLGRS